MSTGLTPCIRVRDNPSLPFNRPSLCFMLTTPVSPKKSPSLGAGQHIRRERAEELERYDGKMNRWVA
jgi:hypothetical protein